MLRLQPRSLFACGSLSSGFLSRSFRTCRLVACGFVPCHGLSLCFLAGGLGPIGGGRLFGLPLSLGPRRLLLALRRLLGFQPLCGFLVCGPLQRLASQGFGAFAFDTCGFGPLCRFAFDRQPGQRGAFGRLPLRLRTRRLGLRGFGASGLPPCGLFGGHSVGRRRRRFLSCNRPWHRHPGRGLSGGHGGGGRCFLPRWWCRRGGRLQAHGGHRRLGRWKGCWLGRWRERW